ncbi:MAG: Jag N-terminal domain-containing protein [Clostridia bacterium]|nr:Jag N-terminal domain-containing protein [Clostridia bacterium]
MPNSIISEGKTTNEAIENGLKQLHVTKNQVDVKVLESEDKRSFFSILAPRVVKVELTLKDNKKDEKVEVISKPREIRKYTEQELNTAEDNVKIFLEEFLPKIGQDIKYAIKKDETGLLVSITGTEAGHLIGYRGETLYSVQNILVAVASKNLETRVRVILDIEEYKNKRVKTLEELAERMEKRVIRTGRPVTLEPMKPYERKIIHSKLQNSNKVTTHSIGEEPRRRLVISLK